MNKVLLKPEALGRVLRLHRERRKLTQSAVAGSAGISVSMLSQIELGRVSPSIDTMLQVCAALGLEAVDLFRHLSPSKPVRIHRQGERPRTGRNGVTYEQLVESPDPGYPAEMFLLEVQPGSQAGSSGGAHEGVELGYVLDGSAVLTVSDESYDVNAGDTISYSAHLPHRLENRGEAVFRAIWSVAPPHNDFLDWGTEDSAGPSES